MYSCTRNDVATFFEIDSFWDNSTPTSKIISGLSSDNWQVQQAVLCAIGDRGLVELLPNIEELLTIQDKLPLYEAPKDVDFTNDENSSEVECWRCRYRVKHSALLAIFKLIERFDASIVSDKLLEKIKSYAISAEDDYPVRSAAAKLLRFWNTPDVIKTLTQATADGEWCTAFNAKKSLELL